jgi:hypothetical protein
MNYSYLLIQDVEGMQNWYMVLREYKKESVAKAVLMWKESAISQMLNGRKGLTLEFINKMVEQNIEDKIRYLNEGKILLINRLGGHMFLEKNHIVLKEIESHTFPVLDNDYINGLLSPEGDFIDCEYGHHHEIAKEIDDNENRYISISHDHIGNNSAIFICDNVTDEQKEFLTSNLHRLDSVHIKMLRQKAII